MWQVTQPNLSKALEKFISEIFSEVEHKKLQSKFLLVHSVGCPKIVNFAPKRNAMYVSGIPLSYPTEFFPLPPEPVRTVYANVITSFLAAIGTVPIFYSLRSRRRKG